MSDYQLCPICHSPITKTEMGDHAKIDCFRCGVYKINMSWKETLADLNLNTDAKIALISGWIREHPNELLQKEPLAIQLAKKHPSVGEKAELLLRGLAKVLNIPGDQAVMTGLASIWWTGAV